MEIEQWKTFTMSVVDNADLYDKYTEEVARLNPSEENILGHVGKTEVQCLGGTHVWNLNLIHRQQIRPLPRTHVLLH